MAVKLDRIYTRGGDPGKTSLGRGTRVDKHDIRVDAYGTVDETNSTVGLAARHRPHHSRRPQASRCRRHAGAHPERPVRSRRRPLHARRREKRGEGACASWRPQVERLEREIDAMNAELAPLKSFILPGGSAAAACLHLARTVSRRAERGMTPAGGRARRSIRRRSSTSTASPTICSCWRASSTTMARRMCCGYRERTARRPKLLKDQGKSFQPAILCSAT